MAKEMIQAVTVSVNYSDFLAETLPYLLKAVDSVLVVTAPNDIKTMEVAVNAGANVFVSTEIFKSGAPFRKGAAINQALKSLNAVKQSWLLHIDADIAVLDPIKVEGLNKEYLYGCDRYCVPGREVWNEIQTNRSTVVDRAVQDTPFLRIQPRKKNRSGRLLPPGFFQLWHGSVVQSYPHSSRDASMDDIRHAEKFKECHLLDGFKVYHLESTDHQLKANWRGRVSAEF